MEKIVIFKNINVITPYKLIEKRCVAVKGNHIKGIYSNIEKVRKSLNIPDNSSILEFKDKYLVPGFIDIHAHGANNVDCLSKSLDGWSLYNLKSGVTSYIPTLMVMHLKDIFKGIENIIGNVEKNKKSAPTKSKILGINIEGPYLNSKYAGAQNNEFIIDIKKKDWEKILTKSSGYLKIMTIAPELPGSIELITRLIEEDVIVALGHSGANYKETCIALENGASLATHIFNAMGNNIVEEAGVEPVEIAEALLTDDKVFTELISDRDGVHVHKVFQKILLKCKGIEKIILISDSQSNAGYKPGQYFFTDGRSYTVKEDMDVLRLDNGVLAGGFFRLSNAVSNFKNAAEISLTDAIKTVTVNPAKLLRIDNLVGSIAPGKLADLNIIDNDLNIYLTMVEGNIVYRDS